MSSCADDVELDIDLSEILYGSYSTEKTGHHNQSIKFTQITEIPFHIIDVAGSDAPACYITALFDGSHGPEASDYAAEKITNNFTASYRSKLKAKDAVDSVQVSLNHAMVTLDKNFTDIATKKAQDSSCEAAAVTVHGPTEAGDLILSTSVVGSPVVLLLKGDGSMKVVSGKPLTSAKQLQKKALANGGELEAATGGVKPSRSLLNKLPKGFKRDTSSVCMLGQTNGLNVIGCPVLKHTGVVGKVVEVAGKQTVLDLEDDLAVVIVSGSIFDALGCETIAKTLLEKRFLGAESAAKGIVDAAGAGVGGGCACLFFGWHKDVFEPPSAEELFEMGLLSGTVEESEDEAEGQGKKKVKVVEEEQQQEASAAAGAAAAVGAIDDDDDMFA